MLTETMRHGKFQIHCAVLNRTTNTNGCHWDDGIMLGFPSVTNPAAAKVTGTRHPRHICYTTTGLVTVSVTSESSTFLTMHDLVSERIITFVANKNVGSCGPSTKHFLNGFFFKRHLRYRWQQGWLICGNLWQENVDSVPGRTIERTLNTSIDKCFVYFYKV